MTPLCDAAAKPHLSVPGSMARTTSSIDSTLYQNIRLLREWFCWYKKAPNNGGLVCFDLLEGVGQTCGVLLSNFGVLFQCVEDSSTELQGQILGEAVVSSDLVGQLVGGLLAFLDQRHDELYVIVKVNTSATNVGCVAKLSTYNQSLLILHLEVLDGLVS